MTAARPARHRLSGRIASAGFASGDRIVVGVWSDGPLGAMNDVMWVRPDGRRMLLAPNRAVANFVTAVYRFDEVVLVPLEVATDASGLLAVEAGALRLRLNGGRRWPIPLRPLRPPLVTRFIEGPIARVLLGVRTYGVTPSGVHEWYQADGYRSVTSGSAIVDGRDLGVLSPVDPPLGVGVSEPPRRASMVDVRPLLFDPAGTLDRVLLHARRPTAQ